jgi:aminopeptidase
MGGGVLDRVERARYADAVVLGCLRLARGDTLFVLAHPDHRELAVALADAGYRAGARLVDVNYVDPLARAARVRHASDEDLGPLTPWRTRTLREHVKPTSAVAHILGEAEIGVFDGLPPERVAEDTMRPVRKLGWYRRADNEGRRRWAAVGWPTPFWAGRVYPDLDELTAQRRLAADLLWFCRLGPDDPPGFAGWERHTEQLARRADALTALALERLELRGPGTALDVRLTDDTRWIGGQKKDAVGRSVVANMPTEECYTSPHPAATEGTFRCSRPLSFQGREIAGIAGEFRRGRLVRLEAASDDDRDFLAAFLDSDRGARRLGEVALVDSSSRIGATGRTYYTTLIDENATAHIAFGSGFGIARARVPGRRPEPFNHSSLHLDVMIGTQDTEATGIQRGGRRVPLIADGAWQV